MKTKDWENNFPLDIYAGETKRELVRCIEGLLLEQRDGICRLIDKIESDEKGSSFDEWRMFKRIRNKIRDNF